jgi:hypothetical protein
VQPDLVGLLKAVGRYLFNQFRQLQDVAVVVNHRAMEDVIHPQELFQAVAAGDHHAARFHGALSLSLTHVLDGSGALAQCRRHPAAHGEVVVVAAHHGCHDDTGRKDVPLQDLDLHPVAKPEGGSAR